MKEKIAELILQWFAADDPACISVGHTHIVREDRDGFSIDELAEFIAKGLERDKA